MAHEIDTNLDHGNTLVVTDLEGDIVRVRRYDERDVAITTVRSVDNEITPVYIEAEDWRAIVAHVDPSRETAGSILRDALTRVGNQARPLQSYRDESAILQDAIATALAILGEA